MFGQEYSDEEESESVQPRFRAKWQLSYFEELQREYDEMFG